MAAAAPAAANCAPVPPSRTLAVRHTPQPPSCLKLWLDRHTLLRCAPPLLASCAGDTNSEYLWCVDPLDGTTNFAHGYPSFAVSVAVLRHTTPVASTGGW